MTDELPQIYIGDHVSDREDINGTMVVVERSLLTAEKTEIENGQTVADYNPDYPEDDSVLRCVFASRDDMTLDTDKGYWFPRSRLERAAPIHDVEDDE